VAVADTFAYLADGAGGLRIINVADPQSQYEVGHCGTPGYSYSLAVADTLVFVTAWDSGLTIINASDRANPYVVKSFTPPSYAFSVAVRDTYAYVACLDSVRVIDVANPQHPQLMGSFAPTGGLAVSDTFVYVANGDSGLGDSGLFIVSVADPWCPRPVGHCATTGGATNVALSLSGIYAYVAGDSGLTVVNVADPQHPLWAGYCRTPSAAWGVAVESGFAYVGDNDAGLRVINVADPQRPYEAGYYVTPGIAYGVALSGACAYVGCSDAGLQAYEFFGAGVEGPAPQAPSSRPGATVVRGMLVLHAATGVERNASCVLLDISGRRVMELVPGPNDVRRLAPGVYFVQMESDCSRLTRKVVLTE
jgi:hypothetical protein